MDFKKEIESIRDMENAPPEHLRELEALLKKAYLAGARDIFRKEPTPDASGWLAYQPKVAMIVTSREPEEQEEQLLSAIKRTLAL